MHTQALEVRLLGGFQLVYRDHPSVEIVQARHQSLLAYLILHADLPHQRVHLAYQFWPDSTGQQAVANLRFVLHQLRRGFPNIELFLKITNNNLHWEPTVPCSVDTFNFEALLTDVGKCVTLADRRASLEAATALYLGDLLPECYDDWVVPIREGLRQRYVAALEQLADIYIAEGDMHRAIEVNTHLLNYESLNEPAYRRLMEIHMLRGDRASALRAYHSCVAALERELGIEPSADIQATYKRLLTLTESPQQEVFPSVLRGVATRLVGRTDELQRLWHAWDRAMHHPYMVIIVGEAGVGKTRLAEEFTLWAVQHGATAARARAYSGEGQLAYAPIAELLRTQPYQAVLTRLNPTTQNELARLVPDLLNISMDLSLPPLAGIWHRTRLFEAMAQAVLAPNQPIFLHFDDLQWADRDTLRWLRFLLRFNPQAHLLIVGTVRPEDITPEHPLNELTQQIKVDDVLDQIELPRLGPMEVATLAVQLAESDLSQEEISQLYDQTGGIPLFVVEAMRVRPAQKGQTASTPSTIISVTQLPRVFALLQSRLIQLSPIAREITQLAAVVGCAFTLELLTSASGMSENTMLGVMDELWQRRILREDGVKGYDFSHDRLRDVAYAEISPARRRVMHRQIAQALEALGSHEVNTASAQIAFHYERAGMRNEAIHAYRKAAYLARHLYASDEAEGYLRRAYALITEIPLGPARDDLALSILTDLGALLITTYDYHSSEVQRVYRQMVDLSRRRSPIALRMTILSAIVRSHLYEARSYADEYLVLAERSQDPVMLVEAHYTSGVTYFWLGKPVAASAHLSRALSLYKPELCATHIAQYGQDPFIICQARQAWTLWQLGHVRQATEDIQSSVHMARELGEPFVLAYTLWVGSYLNHDLGGLLDAQGYLSELRDLSMRHEFSATIRLYELLDLPAAAIDIDGALLRQKEIAMRRFLATNQQMMHSLHIVLFGRAWLARGEFAHAEELTTEGLDFVALTGESFYESELYRLAGDLRLAAGDLIGAEKAFTKALTVAQRQEARSLELRAAMALASLWSVQGRNNEVHGLLAPLVAWFDHDLITADLEAVRAMLGSSPLSSTNGIQ